MNGNQSSTDLEIGAEELVELAERIEGARREMVDAEMAAELARRLWQDLTLDAFDAGVPVPTIAEWSGVHPASVYRATAAAGKRL